MAKPVGCRERFVEQSGVIAGIVGHIGAERVEMARIGHFRRRNQITPTHLDAIEALLCRDRIHQPLAHERALKASGRAIGAAWRLVGQANAPDHVIGADAVGAE